MKKVLIFLLMFGLAFAGWQQIAALSIVLSATLLAISFAVGLGFGINEMQMMAKEEFFQLLAALILIIALIGADGILNGISTNQGLATVGGTSYDTIQEASSAMLSDTRSEMASLMGRVHEYDQTISSQASQSSQCNIMGMGYTVSGCGGYSMLAPALSMSGGIAGFAVGEISAMTRFIEIAQAYALVLLLPVGIVFRTFKMTRGAGGFLIALGIALHIMLPIGIIFTEVLGETFIDDDASADYQPGSGSGTIADCEAEETGEENEENAISAYYTLKSELRKQLYVILVKATLGPVIALLMMITSIKALTSIAGAEVDVSAIARFI